MRIGLARTASPDNAHPLARLGIVDLLRRLTTDPAPRLLAHSALLGLGVVALLCLLAWRPSRGPVGAMARGWRSAVAFLTALVPPLVAGAGVLALGRTAMLSSRFFAASLDWTCAGLWMERIGLAFDPFVFPELVLFVGACLAFLPRRAIRPEPPGRDDASARRVDQIRIAGAGRGPAVWHVWRWARAIPLPTMVLWGTLVATAITPPLVLAPTLESRPIGPGILVLIDQPDDARARRPPWRWRRSPLTSWRWAGRRRASAARAISQPRTLPERGRAAERFLTTENTEQHGKEIRMCFPFLCPSRGQLPPVGWGRSVVITRLDNRRAAQRARPGNVGAAPGTMVIPIPARRRRSLFDDLGISLTASRKEPVLWRPRWRRSI